MPFRVAMFSLHTSPLASLGRTRDAGGMNLYIRELARELGRGVTDTPDNSDGMDGMDGMDGANGMEVDIFTRRTESDAPFIIPITDRVRVIQIAAGPESPLAPNDIFPYVGEFTERVAHFARYSARAYDIIHSHYWLSAEAAMPLARQWDVPHVAMFHTVEQLKGQQYGEDAPLTGMCAVRAEHEGRIAVGVDRVTVSTQHEHEQLRRLYGLAPSHLRIIPCGVDLARFTPGSADARAQAHQALAPDGMPTLLFVGRLDPIKGIDLLLESVARMRTRARLVVVGGDPQHGDPEVARLRGLAADLGIAARVEFPGAAPHDQLPAYYRGADALVVTSRYESFGLVAVEALACGTPVVAARVGGLASVVHDGENGLLVNWRTADEFAGRLDLLLGDAALRARMQAQARPSVERFDWHRIGNEVRALYRELAEDAQQRAVACSGS